MNEDNNRRSYSDDELDRILKEYSSIGRNKTDSDKTGTQNSEKKFVVHLDESLIDDDSSSQSSSHSGNTGGIYFSNYARKSSAQRPASPSSQRRTSDPARPVNRTGNAAGKTNAVKKRVQSIGGKAAVGFLAFIIISTFILSYIGLTCVGDMLAINRSEENIEVVIPPDSSCSQIIDILKENGLIKRKLFCKAFTAYRGFNDEEYLSGNYYLSSEMGVEGMLMDLMAAPVTADSITLAFPEGWTIQQIFEKIEKNDVCTSAKLYSAVRSKTYDSTYKFIGDVEDKSERYLKLEGYLFPDTYDFYVDADANYVIKKFLDNFDAKWEDEYDARAKKLGFSRDEIITIASVIQKEAANSEQMKVISSVIHNRLNHPADYPALQCDSTAMYVSNYVTPIVGESHGKLLYDNYDTYAIRGLPPGPICNPGIDAIRAALYPEDTDYYFFAHDKSGKIYLSRNISEFTKNEVERVKANQNSR